MRIGIRLAISGLVLSSIIVSAVGVHVLWWRTAEENSRVLDATINEQIVAAVKMEVDAITTQARAAQTAIRTLFVQNVLGTREADKREFVFLSQLQAQPGISWVAFGWPDDTFFAAHKLGDLGLEMMEIAPVNGVVKRRVDKYEVVVGDIQFEKRRFVDTNFHVIDQEWYRKSIKADEPAWFEISDYPVGRRPSIAFAGPVDVYQKRQGVLAVMIENTRLAQFLSQLAVGKTGAAFILGRGGTTIAAPDPDADEVHMQRSNQPLLPIAKAALAQAGPSYDASKKTARRVRYVADGKAYAVTLTPLAFPGWTLSTVIPEAEFLGPIETTIRHLLVALAVLILGAGILSAWLARRVIAKPLITVVDELKHVERFELDRVRRHPARITELANLSGALADMAAGLAAFRKYIPADLVKMLLREGVEPRPGGTMRTLTVLFADIAGFTGLSERLGDRIIPLLSTYLDIMSREVSAEGGTIDKFIGDAVMAFWGAPAANADHAVDACRAALACQRALQVELHDDGGRPMRVRIGINSGEMLVGNIGSEFRLNYTVIGDAVNVASRLEGANKDYGTDIIIGEQTRRLAGDRVVVRELDRLMVRGRMGSLAIYELLAMADDGEGPPPHWVGLYEQGLAAYRTRDFAAATDFFRQVLAVRPSDQPSRLMLDHCGRLLESPPAADWEATSAMKVK